MVTFQEAQGCTVIVTPMGTLRQIKQSENQPKHELCLNSISFLLNIRALFFFFFAFTVTIGLFEQHDV